MSFQADAFQNDAFQVDGAAPVIVIQPSGGYFEPARRRRTKADIRADRIRYGVLKEPAAVELVQQVAQIVREQEGAPLALAENEQTALLDRLLLERGVILSAYPQILRAVILEEVERQRAAQAREDEAVIGFLMEM